MTTLAQSLSFAESITVPTNTYIHLVDAVDENGYFRKFLEEKGLYEEFTQFYCRKEQE